MSGSAFVHTGDAAAVCTLSAYRPGLGGTAFRERSFCAATYDETPAPDCGITRSALDGVVNCHLLRPRLTSAAG
ncbi:hypothetical protein [Photorhabdus luminescens]|uniref:hypothetical protein n=1 Tax=Photorhabdus luminescens TaxID=29488 RepID=UPI00159610A7|nr:hypothetical protein [Photorhabdus luminescens]